jgi:hypothetical protein
MSFGDNCPYCHGPLLEIDHYDERLVGCIECRSDNGSYCYA